MRSDFRPTFRWVLLALPLCVSTCLPAQGPAAPPLVVNRSQTATPHDAVPRIITKDAKSMSYGSGTLVTVHDEFGIVLTNWHVVRDAKQILVRFPKGFQSEAKVLKFDEDWDLAALLIWRPDAAPVVVSKSTPRRGDVLTIAGYGSGKYRASTGRCTQYVSPGAHLPYEMVEVSTQARQGDSGGPMFNTKGELAGVLFGAARGTTAGSHCGRIGKFLASVLPQPGSVPQGTPSTVPPSGRESAFAAAPPTSSGAGQLPRKPLPQAMAPSSQAVSPPAYSAEPRSDLAVNRLTNNERSRNAPSLDAAPPTHSLTTRELSPLPDQQIPQTARAPISTQATDTSDSRNSAVDSDTPIRELVTSTPQPQRRTLKADASEQSPESGWQDLVGHTMFEQLKSFFAAIGFLTLVSLLLKRPKEAK